jgi:hypothetical protein
MSRFVSSFVGLAVLAAASGSGAQATQRPPTRAAASSFATVEVHINARPIGRQWYQEDASLGGPARIAISYGQPHARGRAIVGGLIPNDTVWRLGANQATTLHTEVDLTLGDLALPRGDYSLFLLHSRDSWQLIVNSRTAEWGTDYDPTKDVGRVSLAPRATAENEDTFTVYLVPDSPNPATGFASLSGVLRLRWGMLELKTPWTVRQ